MRTIVLLLLFLIGAQVHAYVKLLKNQDYLWKNARYNPYINPEGIPDWYGWDHPRLTGPLSAEVQKEIRTQLFEWLQPYRSRKISGS